MSFHKLSFRLFVLSERVNDVIKSAEKSDENEVKKGVKQRWKVQKRAEISLTDLLKIVYTEAVKPVE